MMTAAEFATSIWDGQALFTTKEKRERKKGGAKERMLVRAGQSRKKSVKGVRRKEGDGVGHELVRASVTNVTKIRVGSPVAACFDLLGWIAE